MMKGLGQLRSITYFFDRPTCAASSPRCLAASSNPALFVALWRPAASFTSAALARISAAASVRSPCAKYLLAPTAEILR